MKHTLFITHYGDCEGFTTNDLSLLHSCIINTLNVNLIQDTVIEVSISKDRIYIKTHTERAKKVLEVNRASLLKALDNFVGMLDISLEGHNKRYSARAIYRFFKDMFKPVNQEEIHKIDFRNPHIKATNNKGNKNKKAKIK